MIKITFYFILIFNSMASFAQLRTESFNIAPSQTTPLKLSDIAEKTTVIPLEKKISLVQGMFWTGDYLFIASLKDIYQYNASGKFIRSIPCNGKIITGITGNISMNEFYVSVNISDDKCEIWSYNYLGKIKRKIALKNPSVVSILFHNDLLWVLSQKPVGNNTQGYYSYIDMFTETETFLTNTVNNPPIKGTSGLIRAGFLGTLSASNNCLYVNWDDNVIWRIKNKKVDYAYKCLVNKKYRSELIAQKGVIGNFLFFKYHLDDDDSNLYLRNLVSGKTYNVKYKGAYGDYSEGAVEDVYQSGFFDFDKEPLTQEGYFWFIKNMQGKYLKEETVEHGQVVFIVKTKK